MEGILVVIVVAVFVLIVVGNSVRVIREWERGVLLRFGRFDHIKMPGIRLVWPIIDKILIIDTRVVTMDVPKQEIITKDNVSAMVDAVVFFQVVNAEYAVTKVENWVRATSLQAQTSLRSVIGQSELDQLLSERDKINMSLQNIIDEVTEPWGIKVTAVEVRDVTLPDTMKRAMANQAETERERRAKIINAEGEFQAAQKLTDAADVISANPQALQLRYLQTLREIGSSSNTTIVFPMPIDLIEPLKALLDNLSPTGEKKSE
ncbi:MAG: slipin family protein [Armatimonadota bacterium]|jgi:regulator of protease activity HflC (stomatin/prohibitin superfamily)